MDAPLPRYREPPLREGSGSIRAMKRPLRFGGLLLPLAPLFLTACGGGGGGGNPNPGVDLSDLSRVRIDAILVPSDAAVDPSTIFVGETVKFRLTGIATGDVRQFVDVRGFSTDAPGSAGRISSDGTFIASGTSNPFTVRVTVGGTTYTTTAQVKPVQAIVTGFVRTLEGLPAPRHPF